MRNVTKERKKRSNLTLCRKKMSTYVTKPPKNAKRCRSSIANITPHNLNESLYEKRTSMKRGLMSPRTRTFTPSKSPATKRFKTSASPLALLNYRNDKASDYPFIATKLKLGSLKPARLSFQEPDKPEEVTQVQQNTQPVILDDSLCVAAIESDEEIPYVTDKTYVSTCSAEHGEVNSGPSKNQPETDIQEMIQLGPFVIDILNKKGLSNVFLEFFRQIHRNSNSVNNISFLLWAEIVKWYNQGTSTTMRYMDETKMFWKLGWQLFGGKFLRFMSGYKNESQIVFNEVKRGSYMPEESDINFAVPGKQVLRDFKPYGSDMKGVRHPGIFDDVIETIAPALSKTSCCITFDGKKLKQGLTKSSGDIDILGFEDGQSLNDRQSYFNSELEKQQTVLDKVTDLEDLGLCMDADVTVDLKQQYTNISAHIQEIKKLKSNKEYALKKFIERGGTDWRKSKFIYAISALQAYIFDIDCFLSKTEDLLNNICNKLVYLQGSHDDYVLGSKVYLKDQKNLIELPEEPNENNPRKIKQRSDKWFELRNEAKVTGSTIYKAIGMDGLSKLKEHFDKVICGVDEPAPTEFAQKAMEHGSRNEINAVATIVTKVLPAFMPDLEFQEEGCVPMYDSEGKVFMVVSPDGSLRQRSDSPFHQEIVEAAVEIKCPVREVHTNVPVRYYLQCISETEALNVDYLLFVSWTNEITNVFKIKRDTHLLSKVLRVAQSIYGNENPKRPTKLHQELKEIKEEIKQKIKSTEYVGQFMSVRSEDHKKEGENIGDITESEATACQRNYASNSLEHIYKSIMEATHRNYELRRQKATEAVVFLCCDLDRVWSKDRLMWSPICWFPKGYSLTTDVIRKVLEEVLDRCAKVGLHVPCCSFDGQWHNISVRTVNGEPLTVLQLQKDVWRDTLSKPKNELESSLKEVENVPQWRWQQMLAKVNGKYKNTKKIVCTNGGVRLPTTPTKGWPVKGRKKQLEVDKDTTEVIPDLASVVSENIIECARGEGNDVAILQHHHDAAVFQEIASCNVTEEEWADVLQDIQDEGNTDSNGTKTCIENEMEYNLQESIDLLEEEGCCNQQHIVMKVGQDSQQTCTLNTIDYQAIHALLKCDKNANKTGKWDTKSDSDVELILQSKDALNGARDTDIRVISRYLKKVKGIKIREYDTKATKIKNICEVLNISANSSSPSAATTTRIKKRHIPKTLVSLSYDVVKKLPKQVLNVSYAEYVWPERLDEWQKKAPIDDSIKINGMDEPDFWFYVPEYSISRNQLELKCIDSTHLLTRTRRKTCHGGIEGLDNKPWLRVAKQGTTFLTPVMVEDIVDPMSMSMAVTHFGKSVQNVMFSNGDHQAASLSQAIHDWWTAEDDPGIDAASRIQLRMKLRRRLLQDVSFDQFPPPGSHIKGWPLQLWEALLAGIDAKAILYSLTKTGTYGNRAFSSMMGETFFAELTNQDKGCHGTVSADEFGRYISRTIEQMQMRLDAKRTFVYRTSSTAAYRLVDKSDVFNEEENVMENRMDEDVGNIRTHWRMSTITEIIPRNHFFDSKERSRLKGRKKQATVSKDRNALQKGSLGVRWEKARRNESKMLITKRMGLEQPLP